MHVEKYIVIHVNLLYNNKYILYCFAMNNVLMHVGAFLLERGSSAVECRTHNQVSPGSNPPLLPFRRLGIFVLSIDAPVDSAV